MQNATLVYQRQAIMNASPLKLVVKMYDLLIQASYRGRQKVREILSGLIQGLNFDYEPAGQLSNYIVIARSYLVSNALMKSEKF